MHIPAQMMRDREVDRRKTCYKNMSAIYRYTKYHYMNIIYKKLYIRAKLFAINIALTYQTGAINI